MAERFIIDPLTRIEGHLRVELEAEDQKITKAWSEATQFRGIETILKGRDPRDAWAFTQRICGVCTAVHAVASIVAVEDALDYEVPETARLIRDIVLGNQTVQDHVIHFYHLQALDWVDVASAASGSPSAAAAFAASIGSTWRGNSVERMTEVQATLQGVIESGQLSIFTGGYWGHPAYKLPPAANLMAVAHYLDALEFQRSMIRVGTVFGGKNPHPNFLVGGMACSINLEDQQVINQVQIDQIRVWMNEILDFVHSCYYPDVVAVMGAYKDWFDFGAGPDSFLAVGSVGATYAGDPAAARTNSSLNTIKAGVLLDGDYKNVQAFDPAKVEEYVSSAWFTQSAGDDKGLHPSVGETTPKYTGPALPWEWLGDQDKYTWSKAPRYDGRAVQVGPLARVMLAYAQGDPRTKELVDGALSTIGITLEQLNSTPGRILARAIESVTCAELMVNTTFKAFTGNIAAGRTDVFNAAKWEPSTWPKEASGYSFVEVARGDLSHWVTIKNGAIDNYQAVVPTTWLAGGRDPNGQVGPYEHSLAGDGKTPGNHPLEIADQPLEPLRTIHSFDPCLSCAVHVLDSAGDELARVVTS
jgi:hydrogenase large subunit